MLLQNLTPENFAERLAQANLVAKADFDNKLTSLNRKITSSKTKHLVITNELKKLKIFDAIYFHGKSHFEDDSTQNWLVFQSMQKYFKTVITTDSNILSWKSKRLSDESTTSPTTSNKILNPSLNFVGTKARVKLNGDCLKQEKITFNYEKIVNIYIVYEIEKSIHIRSYLTIENCLFATVKLKKHNNNDDGLVIYKYSGDGMGFDRKGFFLKLRKM